MRLWLLAVLLASAPAARAALITGGDYAGADLAPANGDTLSGTFRNVGMFSLTAGATVFVQSGTPLVIYASTAAIYGTLDGSGRGQPGGSGGQNGGPGSDGFGGSSSSSGQGSGASSGFGGGGGAYGGAGGAGAGTGGGAGGAAYGASISSPLSADDVFPGSGGGGGGGATTLGGGSGSAGGAAVFIEASSLTITGAILVAGIDAGAVTNSGFNPNPGSGGGGAGGGVLLRVTGALSISGARLDADGGAGGDVADFNGNAMAPGGGGSGGRIMLFARVPSYQSVTLSTAAGAAGGNGGFGSVSVSPNAAAGGIGAVSYGLVAAPPSAFAAQAVYVTSVAWSWTATGSFGDAPAGSDAYRVFPGTATAPLAAPQATVPAPATSVTETGLSPNTTYYRYATAFSDWGDSAQSNAVSTHTLAAAPSGAAFTAAGVTSLTAAWTAGSPANPSYTVYEVQSALDSGFSTGLQDGFTVGLSSSPAGLKPNTTYYLRSRAVNLDGVPTDFTAVIATATLAATPSSPALPGVFISSAGFSWSGGANPAGTQYEAEVSSDNFFTLVGSSATLNTGATFFTLSPGTQYFFRVRAVNVQGTPTAYSSVVSANAGNLSNTAPPSVPGTPAADRQFSYDGSITFFWSPAQSPVGILDYELLVGSFPGGNDVFNGAVFVASYTATGLATGKTYYAQVRARTNAGAIGPFSGVSEGVQVFLPQAAAAIDKPYAWPNPFNPSQGPAQIGFFLPQPGDVTFRVYSLNGRLLKTFSQSYGAAGNQIGTWDGADDTGRRVAPGGYIVLLRKSGGDQRVKIAVLY